MRDNAGAAAPPILAGQPSPTATPGVFERERRVLVGEFDIFVDRKASAFVSLSSGLSHKGGHIQHIMTPAAARELGEHLIAAAEFGSVPMIGDAAQPKTGAK